MVNSNKTGFVLTSCWSRMVDLINRECDTYQSPRERAAYRAGLSTAAAACDTLAALAGHKNKSQRALRDQALRAGDAITELRKITLTEG